MKQWNLNISLTSVLIVWVFQIQNTVDKYSGQVFFVFHSTKKPLEISFTYIYISTNSNLFRTSVSIYPNIL